MLRLVNGAKVVGQLVFAALDDGCNCIAAYEQVVDLNVQIVALDRHSPQGLQHPEAASPLRRSTRRRRRSVHDQGTRLHRARIRPQCVDVPLVLEHEALWGTKSLITVSACRDAKPSTDIPLVTGRRGRRPYFPTQAGPPAF